jgi:ABC-type Na+ efflux pump permease subunit
MPIKPVEIMLGKIAPYVLVGFIQASLIVTGMSAPPRHRAVRLRYSLA